MENISYAVLGMIVPVIFEVTYDFLLMESLTILFSTQYLQSPVRFTTHHMHAAGMQIHSSIMKPALPN